MKTILARFKGLNGWLQLIIYFCLLGVLINGTLIGRDIVSGGILLRLHAGFFILYLAQIIFILLQERLVWVLAVLQGVLALVTNADFTFIPLVRVVCRVIYSFHEPTVEALNVYKYVLISASFTLQLLSAYAEFSLLPAPASKKIPARSDEPEQANTQASI